MYGTVLHFDEGTRMGLILSEDKSRYGFNANNWRSPERPRNGDRVDFNLDEGDAVEIYVVEKKGSIGAQVEMAAKLVGKSNKTLPSVAWASFLLGIPLIGVIIAYVSRYKVTEPIASHYRYMIRTFWIGAFFMAISFVLAFVIVGYFLMLVTSLWALVRTVKGIVLLLHDEPVSNPTTWLF